MKCASFSLPSDPIPRLGIVRGERILEASMLAAGHWTGQTPDTLLTLVQQGPDAWARIRELAQRVPSDSGHALGEVQLHAPMPRPPKNVFCLGRNYAAHAQEAAKARGQDVKIPTIPVIFTKAPTSVTGPFADIPVNRGVTNQVDWEVELGVIIGTRGVNIKKGDALAHVFGYTVINDLSAREVQQQHMQWFKG